MLNRIALAVLVSALAGPAPAVAGPLLDGQAAPTDTQGTPEDAQDSGKPTAEKGQKGPKGQKAKKPKKAKSDVPSPDENIDPDAPEAGGEDGFRFVWKQHPSIRYGSIFRMDFAGKLQEDARAAYPDAKGLQDPITLENQTWEFHRNRFGIQGHVYKKVEYEVEYEFTESELTEKDIQNGVTPKSQWKDVYLNFTFVKNAQVKVGKFKIPFGLDQLTGVTHNDFIHRSLGANYLDPARDIGGMVHGRFFKHGLNYWAGMFQHDGDNARSKKIEGGDATVAARVTGAPLRALTHSSANFELGSAIAVSRLSDDSFRPNGLRGRTVLTQDTFYEPVYVNGRRYRWEADADWFHGPASARAEYTLVLDNRDAQAISGDGLGDARARSWYVSGTFLLTGENKRRPVRPGNDFLQGGIGSVELAARVERMWFDSLGSGDTYRSPRSEFLLTDGENALTLGVNWTLNRFVKLQFNAIREDVDHPRNPALPDNFPAGAFWNKIFRLQLVL